MWQVGYDDEDVESEAGTDDEIMETEAEAPQIATPPEAPKVPSKECTARTVSSGSFAH